MTTTKPASRRRLWLMRVGALILAPLLVLGVTELGLRLFGYGFDPDYFCQVRSEGKSYYIQNENFSLRFFPHALARPVLPTRIADEKPDKSYRIFLFGESAANGDPDPTYGLGRYLEVLLRERYPGTRFEVVCVAITAINSNVVLPIARECAQHQGDLWLVYMGNNEMVGPFGAETSYGPRAPSLPLIRTVLALKSTRTGQAMDAILERFRRDSSAPNTWGGMQMFVNNHLPHDDPARQRVYAHFRRNLEDILRAAHGAGVPVVLSTVAVNLKDCAPFASVHGSGMDTNEESAWDGAYQKGMTLEEAGDYGEALARYEEAARIDSEFADLQFRMGRCDLALTNVDQARRGFECARDFDALQFRADSRINSTIREAASRHAGQGVHLLDAASLLAAASPDGVPGADFFYEHVHLNFAGNYLLAQHSAELIRQLLPSWIVARDQGNWATPETCDRRLAVTVWDRQRVWQPIFNRISVPPFTTQLDHAAFFKMCASKLEAARAQMATQTPEQARQMYEEALARAPDDALLHGNYERFLEAAGDLRGAIAEAKRVCDLTPENPAVWYYVGRLLVRDDKVKEAQEYFQHALALRGDYAEAQVELGEILANQQETAAALRCFRSAIGSNPKCALGYIDLGLLQQRQGELAAAMANFKKAANLEPDGPADYFNHAKEAAALGNVDDAVAHLQAVVKAKPDFWQARAMLGAELVSQTKTEEAQIQFLEVIRYRPDQAEAHLQLGLAYAAQRKPDLALEEFRAVLRLEPSNRLAQQQIESLQSSSH